MALALLLMSPMLFLDVEDAGASIPASARFEAAVVSLPPLSADGSSSLALKLVYDWLSLYDPTIFIHPDVDLGFARFRPMPEHDFRSPLPANVWQPPVLAMPSLPAVVLPIRLVTLAELIAELWPRDTLLSRPTPPQWQAPSGIFWRDQRGRQVIDPPIIQPDSVSQAIADHGQPQDVTLLEIVVTPLLPMPRAVIRQSCGNQRLDELLLEAVRDHFQRQPFTPATTGPRRPRQLLLEIDWRRPASSS